jgi:formylglycine-generating enzyme required for sulfatase activity
MKLIRHFLILALAGSLAYNARANDLQITNISVNQSSLGSGTVSFTVSWNNAWNLGGSGANWDAVWIFLKFKLCSAAASAQYTQGQISNANGIYNTNGLYIPSSLQLMSTLSPSSGSSAVSTLDDPNGLGIMLSPTATGSGLTVTGNVTLPVTNLPASGTAITTQVVGIEMVYVPSGPFNLGDGSNNTTFDWSAYHYCVSNASSAPVSITSANETAGSTYYYMATSSTYSAVSASIPAVWPKGYYSFYCMKYEISEDLYAMFLNTIGSTAAGNRYPANYGSNRNQLQQQTLTSYVANRPYRAQNWLSWADWEAVLDWAALRPMTEFEFEKACRGGTSSTANSAIAGEYPWQSPQISGATTISGVENGTETITNQANCNFGNVTFSGGDGGSGPLRSGIFATATSGEVSAGATYYGVLDMAGNVREYVVQLNWTAAADTFQRALGDGQLVSVQGQNGGNVGDANVQYWPAPNGIPATGIGVSNYGNKGGDWSIANTTATYNYLQTSDRQLCNYSGTSYLNVSRTGYSGGRGVR